MMALEVRKFFLTYLFFFRETTRKEKRRKKSEKKKKLTSFFFSELEQKKKKLHHHLQLQEKFEVTLDEEGAEGIATVSDAADLILSKLG